MNNAIAGEWREHLRLALLRLLTEAPGQEANDSVLAGGVRRLGFAASRDQVNVELAWLTEQGLVTSEAVGHLTVAGLTSRGDETALGIVTVPGVQRPARRR
jgi:hypothetical protein